MAETDSTARSIKRRIGILVLTGLLVLNMSGCSTFGMFGPQGFIPWPIPTSTPADPEEYHDLAREDQWLIDLYKRVNPSVVNVRMAKQVDQSSSQLPSSDDLHEKGVGSGFVFDLAGHIVTNNHVVEGTAELEVAFSDGTVVEAQIVGADPDSDLAVIRVDVPPERLHAVELADSDELAVGQRAIAIGNPFGLEGTLTTGVVSALKRTLRIGHESERVQGRFSIPGMIQTDAAINPGNSGGPLLDYRGRVIGINTAINSISGVGMGVGFAVSVNMIKRVVPKLIEEGHYVYPWLGVTGTDVTPDHVKAMDLAVSQGALVTGVVENGPAGQAGLRGSTGEVEIGADRVETGGDVIIGIDENPVRKFDELLAYLVQETEPGQQIVLRIIRGGKELRISVTLGTRPGD